MLERFALLAHHTLGPGPAQRAAAAEHARLAAFDPADLTFGQR
jgi:hypothetical protein